MDERLECFEAGLVERLTVKYPEMDVAGLALHVAEAHWLRPLQSPSGYLVSAARKAHEAGQWNRGARQAAAQRLTVEREQRRATVARWEREAAPPDAARFWGAVVEAVLRGATPAQVAAAVRTADAAGEPWIGPAARSLRERCEGAADWRDAQPGVKRPAPAEQAPAETELFGLDTMN